MFSDGRQRTGRFARFVCRLRLYSYQTQDRPFLDQPLRFVIAYMLDASLLLDKAGQVAQVGEVDLAAIANVLNPAAPVAGRLPIAAAMFPPDAHDERSIALLHQFATHSILRLTADD